MPDLLLQENEENRHKHKHNHKHSAASGKARSASAGSEEKGGQRVSESPKKKQLQNPNKKNPFAHQHRRPAGWPTFALCRCGNWKRVFPVSKGGERGGGGSTAKQVDFPADAVGH